MDNPLILWDGVFNSLENVREFLSRSSDKGLNLESKSRMKWVENQERLLLSAKSGKLLRTFSLMNHIEENSTANILDFGGGIGWGFTIVSQICPKTKYYILETPESNLLFKDFWKKKEMSPIFHSDYKEIEDHIDIFYVNSVLQYLENNDHLIDVISFFSPAKIIMDEVIPSDSIEFYSLQNHWDKKIPYRFLNFSELHSKIENLGYRLSSSEIGPINIPIGVRWEIEISMNKTIAPRNPMNLIFTKH